jgi:hypothetical protein
MKYHRKYIGRKWARSALGRSKIDGQAWFQENAHITLQPEMWWVTATKHTVLPIRITLQEISDNTHYSAAVTNNSYVLRNRSMPVKLGNGGEEILQVLEMRVDWK